MSPQQPEAEGLSRTAQLGGSSTVMKETAATTTAISIDTGDEKSLAMPAWQAAILYAAILALAFFPVLFQNRTILFSADEQPSIMSYGAYYGSTDKQAHPSDRTADSGAPAWNLEPWMKLTGDLYRSEGCVPLWNQYSGCGAPYLANMQSQVLFPLMAAFSMFASSWAHDLFVLSRLLLSGIFAFFALRMLAPGKAALVGAAVYMLTGYQLILIGMPEISVSTVLPLLMLGTEALIRKQNMRAVLLCAVGVGLTLLGGMPELAFVEFLLSGLYALARLSVVPTWKSRFVIIGWLAGAYAAGLLIAAQQVFTFYEYMPYSMNIHDPSNVDGLISGIVGDLDWVRGSMSYIWPAAFKVPFFPRGFFGTTAAIVGLIGFVYGASLSWKRNKSSAEQITQVCSWFFGSALVFLVLKRFACPLVNWIGYLPMAKMVYFAKYDEPLIGFCAAALVAIGVGAALRRELRITTILASLATFVIASAGIMVWYHMVPHGADQDSHRLFLRALYVSIALTVVSCAVLTTLVRYKRMVLAGTLVLLACVCVDAYFGFIGRVYTVANLPSRNLDPYKGAPFVPFLQQKLTNNDRMCGLTYLFIPEWSGAFNIRDVRSLDAMYPSGILTFWHNLLPDMAYGNTGFPEFWERFFGGELSLTRVVQDPQERMRSFHRLAALSSAKYIISSRALPTVPSITPYNQMNTPLNQKTFFKECVIQGVKEECLMQHPEKDAKPGEVHYYAVVPKSAALFSFNIVRNPNPDGIVSAEGVTFNIDVATEPDKWTSVFSEFFNPKTDADRLKPEPHTIDLSKYAGQRVWLRFSVGSGPQGVWDNEWIAWHHMRWHDKDGKAPAPIGGEPQEKLIYDKDVKVYELSPVLARASVFQSIKIVEDPKQVLATLRAPEFDPLRSIVVNRKDLTAKQQSVLSELSAHSGSNNQAIPAQITRSTSRLVDINLPSNLEQPSFLLLTDTFYPGWRALVDGKEAEVIKANYSFRTIVLPANSKHVNFIYDPISYRLGSWLCLLTLAGLLIACSLEFLIMKRSPKLS